MNDISTSLLLLLLLCADFTFIVLIIIRVTLVPDSSLCNTAGLCAYIKSYHLVKLLWVIILFAYILKKTRCSGYIAWILVFMYYFFDDVFQLHQNVGSFIANTSDEYLSSNLGLQQRQNELAFLAISGAFLLAFLGWAYYRSPQIFRKISKDMILFIFALVFFSAIVDLAVAIKLGPAIISKLKIVEDAGEIVVVSLILWYDFLLAVRKGKPDVFLHDLLWKPLTKHRT